MGLHNNRIPNVHLRKHWDRHVRTFFSMPMRKKRRARVRAEKARRIAPRPSSGPVRPIVRCPTNRYNMKERLGRGFTLEELEGAKINHKFAKSIGISVDFRRRNKNVEALQQNIQRLKEYRSRLILFPRKAGQPKQGDSTEDEIKLATQLQGAIMPISKVQPEMEIREITDDEKKFQAYGRIRMAWKIAKTKGKRDKAARDAAEATK